MIMFKKLVRDFPYIHQGIALFGNACFVVGSVLFFKAFEAWYTFAVWLFVLGSSGMLIGALGDIIRTAYEARERRADEAVARTARRRMETTG